MKNLFFILMASLFFGGCKQAENHTPEEIEADHDHGDDVITLSKEKAELSGVKVEPITTTAFQKVIKTGGKILSAQGDETTVVATVSGIVSISNSLTEGAPVGASQNILTISSNNLQDGDPTKRAKLNYEMAKKEYERVLPLIDSKIVSQKEFAKIEQEYENAKITYEASATGHSSKGQQIKATKSGFIKSTFVQEGSFVEVGQPLFSITQNKQLYLRAEVGEKYFTQLKDINSAHFKAPYQKRVSKLSDLNGKVVSYGKNPAEDSHLIPITFSFNNQGEIIPGSYVEVFLLSQVSENSYALPLDAITEEQGLFFVYKQVCVEEYEKVEVTLGNNNGELVQILSGIKEGDPIVVAGAQQLKLASASSEIPAHSHEH